MSIGVDSTTKEAGASLDGSSSGESGAGGCSGGKAAYVCAMLQNGHELSDGSTVGSKGGSAMIALVGILERLLQKGMMICAFCSESQLCKQCESEGLD